MTRSLLNTEIKTFSLACKEKVTHDRRLPTPYFFELTHVFKKNSRKNLLSTLSIALLGRLSLLFIFMDF
jgi:hypothetical protein